MVKFNNIMAVGVVDSETGVPKVAKFTLTLFELGFVML